MKMGVYSVFDAAVGAFLPPFFSRAKGEALRSFVQACHDEKHQFALHASDYALFELGTFDDSTGWFECPTVPNRLLMAIEVKGSPEFVGESPQSVDWNAHRKAM